MKTSIITLLALLGFNLLVILFEHFTKWDVQWFAGLLSGFLAVWVMMELDKEEQ